MPINERKLEEDEAKIDNILHKVVNSADKIRELNEQIDPSAPSATIEARKQRIAILVETIINLATLADEIDISDEKITEEVEGEIKKELRSAVSKIMSAQKLLDEEI